MTILITGGAGYIGSHMMWALLDKNEVPVIIDNLSSSSRPSILSEIPFYHADIADKDAMSKIMTEHKIDSVFHFSGSISVPESIKKPLKYYRNNTINSQNLIESAIKHGIENFIFSSTAAVYGIPKTSEPIKEEASLRPLSAYGHSKLMTERILADTAQAHENFNYAALRYFNVAGADPKERTGQSTKGAISLIKVACEAALGKRDYVDIFGTDYDTPDGTCIRDFIHVSDLVNAHLSALDTLHQKSNSLVANCGYGKGFSVLEVLKAVMLAADKEFEIRKVDRRVGDIINIIADNTRICSLTDWKANHDSLDEIVSSAYNWEQILKKTGAKTDHE